MIDRIEYNKQPIPTHVYKLDLPPSNTTKKFYKAKGSLPKETLKESTKKVSIFENTLNTKSIAVDTLHRGMGERPIPSFQTLIDYRNRTPQIDTIGSFICNMITGTDMNINADDEQAKKICEEFAEEINLYEKIRSLTDSSLTCGYQLMVRVLDGKKLVNIEEFDISSLVAVERDQFGNVVKFIQRINHAEVHITDVENHIPLVFNRLGRDAFGKSYFHALTIPRTVGNRTTRPLIEALWSLDDVVIGTLENFAYPVEYHIFENANPEELELEAQKLRDSKPGDRFVQSKPHVIDRREPSRANFDAFIAHFKNIIQHGTGFPLDMLTGDFTSRASSETADTFFMRKIRAYQKYLTKFVKTEIFEYLLKSLGWDQARIRKANLTVEFEVENTKPLDAHTLLQYTAQGVTTRDEAREWLKSKGLDLFDDEPSPQAPDPVKMQQQTNLEIERQVSMKKLALLEKLEKQSGPDPKIKERAEEIKDRIFTERVEKAITERLNAEVEKIREQVEDLRFNRKAKEKIIETLEGVKDRI